MLMLLVITCVGLLVSFVFDRRKTMMGVRKGIKMFLGILPDLLVVLVLAAILLALIPQTVIVRWLGKDAGMMGMITAALVGAVALIPGFIAYPLAAVLQRSGVSLDVVAVFITTLMMVGIVTLPVERRFFGWKVALYRNGLSFAGALVVGLLMGVFL